MAFIHLGGGRRRAVDLQAQGEAACHVEDPEFVHRLGGLDLNAVDRVALDRVFRGDDEGTGTQCKRFCL